MPLPESFKTEDEFLGYCDIHSKTQRALFNIHHANTLYEMAGYPLLDFLDPNQVVPIHEAEMNTLLKIIERRRNSIEGVCEEIPATVVRLDDYR